MLPRVLFGDLDILKSSNTSISYPNQDRKRCSALPSWTFCLQIKVCMHVLRSSFVLSHLFFSSGCSEREGTTPVNVGTGPHRREIDASNKRIGRDGLLSYWTRWSARSVPVGTGPPRVPASLGRRDIVPASHGRTQLALSRTPTPRARPRRAQARPPAGTDSHSGRRPER